MAAAAMSLAEEDCIESTLQAAVGGGRPSGTIGRNTGWPQEKPGDHGWVVWICKAQTFRAFALTATFRAFAPKTAKFRADFAHLLSLRSPYPHFTHSRAATPGPVCLQKVYDVPLFLVCSESQPQPHPVHSRQLGRPDNSHLPPCGVRATTAPSPTVCVRGDRPHPLILPTNPQPAKL